MLDRRFSWIFLALIISLAPLLAACDVFEDIDGDEDETEEVETATPDEETAEETEEATPEEDGTPEGEEPGPGQETPEPGETPAADETPDGDEQANVGQEIFSTVCAACHQPEGEGVEGIFPALAGNPFVTADNPDPVINVLLTGRGGMPRFGGTYSNEEIAAIVSYIRTSLGNDASEVTAEDVQAVRDSLGPEDEEDPDEAGAGQRDEEGTPTAESDDEN